MIISNREEIKSRVSLNLHSFAKIPLLRTVDLAYIHLVTPDIGEFLPLGCHSSAVGAPGSIELNEPMVIIRVRHDETVEVTISELDNLAVVGCCSDVAAKSCCYNPIHINLNFKYNS